MNLTHDAMLVSLRITAWSGRLHDRRASKPRRRPPRGQRQRRALQQAPAAEGRLRRARRHRERGAVRALRPDPALGRPGRAPPSRGELRPLHRAP